MEKLFDILVSSLWAPATYAKLLFIAVTSPFWWPLAKAMYHEAMPALNADEDAPRPRMAPGEDPFLSVPLAAHRAQQGTRARTPGAPARGGFARR